MLLVGSGAGNDESKIWKPSLADVETPFGANMIELVELIKKRIYESYIIGRIRPNMMCTVLVKVGEFARIQRRRV